jgi:ABC-type uncharacterized transport system involved in gliding motility auxiliary subunit
MADVADVADTKEPVRAGILEEGESRRARGNLHVWFSLVLVAFIGLELNYLSHRHYARWDWTEQAMYTLSDRTETELAALDEDVELYLFLSEAEPNYPEVQELLERYQAQTPRLTVRFIDPDREPSEFQVLAQRFGVSAGMTESGQTMADVAAVAVAGESRWTITRDDMIGLDFGSFGDEDEGPKIDVKAEQAITGALVQVTSGEVTKICAATGHGEWSKDGTGDRSLFSLSDELRRDNIEIEPVETLGAAEIPQIPEDCDALFVVGPIRAYGPEEAEAIDDYLSNGGAALFALDPVLDRDRIQGTGLERVLRRWGAEVDPSLVFELDPQRLLPPANPPGPYLVAEWGEHRTMEALSRMGGAGVFSMSRSVRPVDGTAAVTLLSTSPAGWAAMSTLPPPDDFEPRPGDLEGPVSLAVAFERPAPQGERPPGAPAHGGRVVVVGDADWLQSMPLGDPRFVNLDLALAITGWLTERETLISITPKQIDAEPMMITEDDLGDLAVRLLGLMPGAMLLLGFAMWWSRRQ